MDNYTDILENFNNMLELVKNTMGETILTLKSDKERLWNVIYSMGGAIASMALAFAFKEKEDNKYKNILQQTIDKSTSVITDLKKEVESLKNEIQNLKK